jgi:hypothetical protein
MIGMLAVLVMIMNRAKDPGTWRWLTNEYGEQGEGDAVDDREGDAARSDRVEDPPAEPMRPTDLDPEEADAAREEFQAISDRQPLLPEEMPTYRRLLKWVRHQPGDLLARRSKNNLFFTDFIEVPDKCRGRLVHLRLHIRGIHVLEAADNPPGFGRLYELRGWTDQSAPWPYLISVPDLPPGMPTGWNAQEEVSFDGYFFKVMSYEAAESPGKHLFAPLLVGRIVWHPVRDQSGSDSDGTWFWATILGGGLIGLAAMLRWAIVSRDAPLTAGACSAQSSSVEIERWLEQAESVAADPEVEPAQSTDASESNSMSDTGKQPGGKSHSLEDPPES